MTIYTKTTDFQAKDALASGNPLKIVKGTEIDDEFDAIATADATNLKKDGTVTVTGNIPMGTFKLTGLGAGSAATDSANLGQVQAGAYQLIGSIAGTNTITGSLTPAISEYAAGQTFSFVSAGANTGAVTININGLGAKDVTKYGTTALASGDIPSGAVVEIEYDGTRFQICNIVANTVSNLAGGSAGTIPYQSAAGTTAMLAAGTAGQFATSGGAGAPTWTSPASNAETLAGVDSAKPVTPAGLASVSGLVKLNSGTVSAAATLDIVMTAYTSYKNKLLIFNLIPATNAVDLYARLSTDGGATYDAGASNYKYSVQRIVEDGTTGVNASAGATQIVCNGNSIGNNAGFGISGQLMLLDTANAAVNPRMLIDSVYFNGTVGWARGTGFGQRAAAQDTDAIRVLFSSGNIASGSWTLYGYN